MKRNVYVRGHSRTHARNNKKTIACVHANRACVAAAPGYLACVEMAPVSKNLDPLIWPRQWRVLPNEVIFAGKSLL